MKLVRAVFRARHLRVLLINFDRLEENVLSWHGLIRFGANHSSLLLEDGGTGAQTLKTLHSLIG